MEGTSVRRQTCARRSRASRWASETDENLPAGSSAAVAKAAVRRTAASALARCVPAWSTPSPSSLPLPRIAGSRTRAGRGPRIGRASSPARARPCRAAGGGAGQRLALALRVPVHGVDLVLHPLVEPLLEPRVELEHARDVAPRLRRELAHAGPEVARVEGPAVVLGQDELGVAVRGEEDVQVEGGRLRVLLRVVERRLVVAPAQRAHEEAAGRGPDLVEAPRVGVAGGLRVVAALDGADGEEEEGVDGGVLLARLQGQLRVA